MLWISAVVQAPLCTLATEVDRLEAGTHLISLPHVAVEDSSHTLDCRMLQLMIPAHVVINAPGEE